MSEHPPLTGLLVADFSRILAGPYATMLLADLGAEVVKVEGPAGDDTRTWMPPVRGGVSTYYLGINRGKRSIVLDLRDPSDLAPAQELARRADVLIENLRPDGMARFGLDYDSVRAANPGVVYSSISGFGAQAGAHVPGYDLMVQAMSGLMSLTGDPSGPPYRAGISVFDVMAGNHAVIGILAALRHRAATGQGQHVEVNLLSSALTGLVNHSSAWAAAGVVPYRMGNAHPSVCPYEPLPTADDDLIVAAANDGQFRALCEVLGVGSLADDRRFRHNADRTEHRTELLPLLAERMAARGALEWFELLVAAGVPSGPINTIDGGFAFAERFGLEPIVRVGEGERAVPTTRHPIRFSATPVTYRLPPPALDEHGAELRRWLAGPPARRPGSPTAPPALTYAGYLRLPEILGAQHLLSDPPEHDEMLFVIQHQTTELWLKLLLHELRAARDHLAADAARPALKALARVKAVQRMLTEQWSVLATLTPPEYARFRGALGSSSGFQSHQYRAVEFLLGRKDAAFVELFDDPDARALLAGLLAAPTLYDEFLRHLARLGHPVPRALLDRDVTATHRFTPELVPVLRAVYASTDRHWEAYEICESLVDLEDNVQVWRFRHLKTVERTIGRAPGTGGSSGSAFLRAALEHEFFPELYAVRTEIGDDR